MALADIFGVGLNLGLGQNGYMTVLADKRLVADDLKQIMLTNPGERVFDPLFGVGLERFLFEPNNLATKEQIESIIRDQVSKYLPIVTIVSLKIQQIDNSMNIFLSYTLRDYSNAIQTLTIQRDIPT